MDFLSSVYIAVALVQVVLFTIMLLAYAFYKKGNETLSPKISLVVAIKNEIENLPQLIPALCGQNYSNYEIIIVDDYSTDSSLNLLTQYKTQYPQLTIQKAKYPIKESSKKAALTQAVQSAAGEFILFTDADCIPRSTNWIQSMANKTLDKKIVLGISPYFKEKNWVNAVIQYETSITYFLYGTASLLGMPYMGVGRNLLIEKKLLLENKIYTAHQSIKGGDDDLTINALATKRNCTLNVNSDAIVFSAASNTYRERITQKTRHYSVGKYYSLPSKIVLVVINTSWICIYPLFLSLLFIKSCTPFIISLHILRTLLLFSIFGYIPKKSNLYSVGLKSVYLDTFYSFELFILGLKGVLAKKIIWNRKNSFLRKP